MKLKHSRSVFYLFTAMVISSVVIGSYCKTKFMPVSNANAATSSAASTTTSSTTADNKSKYADVDVAMELVKVGEHSYYVQGKAGIATDNAGFISNAGVVITDAGVVLFDALGTPSLANKLLQKIREITDQPIVKVVVSHYHADHIYGLQVFKEQGAEIIAPDGIYEYIDSEVASSRLEERQFSLDPWVNENTYIVKPDKILDDTEKFTVGNIDFTINIIGKAHSDADLTLFVENDKVLFTGDILFEGRVPFIGNHTKHWLETLQSLETNQVTALVPGHGPAAKDPQKAITLTREYLAYMREKMAIAVEEMIDFDEAYEEVDWSKYAELPAFEAANRRNAFQVYLSLELE
ncbi:MBL fold metallo-hydrolase [Cocleimonas sp. KMM 6892]|uniref:MBL fold metallo-hydrolase n=1 Tax=unclassified Cocleimonas TaxID=2639732 RepID=UPI002DB6DBF2|nr:MULTISPECIES: MBL fold metallo-hydrolase [unclassified Cocleimonas]MEB8434138.1 MBL fold metallo-hydrolase [Cocleimonas sp. KMM 6892]MEC4717002.1 MBL fold metallo-hydrolase [Cocleimonas sp. KMM 6895]MEC4746410.1 MBL fold metallo-hydrolase [Cocleimonas sp. KMM 6896]